MNARSHLPPFPDHNPKPSNAKETPMANHLVLVGTLDSAPVLDDETGQAHAYLGFAESLPGDSEESHYFWAYRLRIDAWNNAPVRHLSEELRKGDLVQVEGPVHPWSLEEPDRLLIEVQTCKLLRRPSPTTDD
jgi:hypothetical protein